MAEKKKYIEVKAPILNETIRVLGTPETLHDKTIKIDLTRKLRGKGLEIKLRIFNHNKELIAIPNSMTLSVSYIRRVMRKRADYVEDSFQTKCKDTQIILKPFLITRKKVSRAVKKNLRNTCKEFLIEYTKEKEYIEISKEILDGTLQKTMLPKLKKIYPLSFCDFKTFETKKLDKIDLEKASQEDNQEEIQEYPEEVKEKVKKEIEEEND